MAGRPHRPGLWLWTDPRYLRRHYRSPDRQLAPAPGRSSSGRRNHRSNHRCDDRRRRAFDHTWPLPSPQRMVALIHRCGGDWTLSRCGSDFPISLIQKKAPAGASPPPRASDAHAQATPMLMCRTKCCSFATPDKKSTARACGSCVNRPRPITLSFRTGPSARLLKRLML